MVGLVWSQATPSLAPEVHLFVIDQAEGLLDHLLVHCHLIVILIRGRRIHACLLGQASHVDIGGEVAFGVREEHVVFDQGAVDLSHWLACMLPSVTMRRVVCHV